MRLRLLALSLLVVILAGGIWLWQWQKKKKLSEASKKDYDITLSIRLGDYQKAQKLIQEALKEDSPYKPLFLSYELYLSKEGGTKIDEIKTLKEILSSLKDSDMKALYQERLAYAYYSQGNCEEALKLLEGIKKEDFNYYSAQILLGLCLEKTGKKEQARQVYKKVQTEAKDSYYSNLATALLLED